MPPYTQFMMCVSLWVGIASYRDPYCGQTLFNLFSKAAFPTRIHVQIIEQDLDGDPDCMKDYCQLAAGSGHALCPFQDNIKIYRANAAVAKGPVWARAIQSNLVDDSEFCMQVDAHMDFTANWDLSLFQFWGQTKNEYAVLTTYVAGLEQLDRNINGAWEVPHLCTIQITHEGHIRNEQAKAARWLREPVMTSLWAAGLSFSKCHAEHNVRNDPFLPYVFDGEEFSR